MTNAASGVPLGRTHARPRCSLHQGTLGGADANRYSCATLPRRIIARLMHDSDDEKHGLLNDVEDGVRKFPNERAAESFVDDRVQFRIRHYTRIDALKLLRESRGERWRHAPIAGKRFDDVAASLARDEQFTRHLSPNSSFLISRHGRAVDRSA